MTDRIRKLLTKDLLQKYMGQSLWLYSGMGATQVVNFLSLAVLTRFLPLEAFGQLALIMSFGDTINSLIDFRVWEANHNTEKAIHPMKKPNISLIMYPTQG